jgi:TolB-like protein
MAFTIKGGLLVATIVTLAFLPTCMRPDGRQLNVLYLLDGSVRRAGDRLRVNAELTQAATGGTSGPKRMMPRLRISSMCSGTLPDASAARLQ